MFAGVHSGTEYEGSTSCRNGNIKDNLDPKKALWPVDKRCGCQICPDCTPQKSCGSCSGDCVICERKITREELAAMYPLFKDAAFGGELIVSLTDTSGWRSTSFEHIQRLCGEEPKTLITPIEKENSQVHGKTPLQLAIEDGINSTLLMRLLTYSTLQTLDTTKKLNLKDGDGRNLLHAVVLRECPTDKPNEWFPLLIVGSLATVCRDWIAQPDNHGKTPLDYSSNDTIKAKLKALTPAFTVNTKNNPLGFVINKYYQVTQKSDNVPLGVQVGMHITHINGNDAQPQNSSVDVLGGINSCRMADGSVNLTFSFKEGPKIKEQMEKVNSTCPGDFEQNREALVGRRVRVQWSGGTFYEGTITSYTPTGEHFTVRYDDGDIRTYDFPFILTKNFEGAFKILPSSSVNTESVNPRDFEQNREALVGRRVSVRWSGGTFYEGTITNYTPTGEQFTVRYDDGDIRTYDFSFILRRNEEGAFSILPHHLILPSSSNGTDGSNLDAQQSIPFTDSSNQGAQSIPFTDSPNQSAQNAGATFARGRTGRRVRIRRRR